MSIVNKNKTVYNKNNQYKTNVAGYFEGNCGMGRHQSGNDACGHKGCAAVWSERGSYPKYQRIDRHFVDIQPCDISPAVFLTAGERIFIYYGIAFFPNKGNYVVNTDQADKEKG